MSIKSSTANESEVTVFLFIRLLTIVGIVKVRTASEAKLKFPLVYQWYVANHPGVGGGQQPKLAYGRKLL